MNEPIHRPASAYYLMAELLPSEYFTRPPPPVVGMRLAVMGSDGIVTKWDMDDFLGQSIAASARVRGLTVSAKRYDDTHRYRP